MLSAVVGCIVRLFLGHIEWLSGAVGMSLALLVMMLTKTIHPVIHNLNSPSYPVWFMSATLSPKPVCLRKLVDVPMLSLSRNPERLPFHILGCLLSESW